MPSTGNLPEPTIGRRIAALIALRRTSVPALAKLLGLDGKRLENVIGGHSGAKASDEEIQAIASALDANERWIRSGRGAMIGPEEPSGRPLYVGPAVNVTDEMIDRWSEKKVEAVARMIESAALSNQVPSIRGSPRPAGASED